MFGDDPILVHHGIKRIMSGRNFLGIIIYLHICDMKKQSSRGDYEYYALFKVRDFHKNMGNRFNICLYLDVS